MFNPAAAISQVVAGNLGPSQFFTVVGGEMVGAILGGLTIYLLYMPQLYKAGEKVRATRVHVAASQLVCGRLAAEMWLLRAVSWLDDGGTAACKCATGHIMLVSSAN
jgi:glycerol uptake facilitator-like aquaporin